MDKGALNIDGSQLLDLMITHELEEDFKILFTPRIANQWKNQEITSVGRKFYETLLEEIAHIYQFDGRAQNRAVSTTEITRPATEILERIPGNTTLEKLETIGKKIYQKLFPPNLKSYLMNSSYSTIVISSDKYPIPFELMHDGTAFLATKHQFYRKPLGTIPPKQPSAKAQKMPYQVVFFTNPTGDLPGAEEETNRIIEFFEHEVPKEIEVEFKNYCQEGASWENLNYRFFNDRLDIFHYSGHSKVNGTNIYFYLKKDPFSVTDIALQYPALFFLNMCESDITVKGKTEFHGFHTLNFPIAIMQKGAKACIATLWPIMDDTAAQFAIHFYRQILLGKSFGDSIQSAKVTLSQITDPNDITWMSFILYGDPADATLLKEGEELQGQLDQQVQINARDVSVPIKPAPKTELKVEADKNVIEEKEISSGLKKPFGDKLVNEDEFEILTTIESELGYNYEITNFEVNEEGNVTSIDFSQICLETVPESLLKLPFLMEVNFSSDSFTSDDDLMQLRDAGKNIMIAGEKYEPELRIRGKMDEIKQGADLERIKEFLTRLTVPSLREFASPLYIPRISSLKKEELVNAISKKLLTRKIEKHLYKLNINPDLKDICWDLNVYVSGRKEELIKRILSKFPRFTE